MNKEGRQRLADLEERLMEAGDQLAEMADYGPGAEHQPELQDMEFDLRERMRTIREEIARLNATLPADA